jgi:hypothetical protein
MDVNLFVAYMFSVLTRYYSEPQTFYSGYYLCSLSTIHDAKHWRALIRYVCLLVLTYNFVFCSD